MAKKHTSQDQSFRDLLPNELLVDVLQREVQGKNKIIVWLSIVLIGAAIALSVVWSFYSTTKCQLDANQTALDSANTSITDVSSQIDSAQSTSGNTYDELVQSIDNLTKPNTVDADLSSCSSSD